ncbi:hypothetical protein F3Y22_tig00117048pilonHSYRG00507 [Hibiscus syriacus]|uniref:Uncharacterized protein n=1 Tax=Hibiscus syriacus TaxID=106335 RepID=A0A6A2WXS7_HIBSY|nr:hypothetical protein F3Y22_tig00117048pilonHSYRG00507 [Hibiscus syriacus]
MSANSVASKTARKIGIAVQKAASRNKGWWYDPHMAAAANVIAQRLPLVDLVAKIRDASIPLSSEYELLRNFPSLSRRIVAMNKIDIADPTQGWVSFNPSDKVPSPPSLSNTTPFQMHHVLALGPHIMPSDHAKARSQEIRGIKYLDWPTLPSPNTPMNPLFFLSYTCQITTPENKEGKVDEVGGFTKSGRCYAPGQTKKARFIVINENEDKMNKLVKIEEAQEFLKFLKHIEYNIVEQLHITPTRISILSLFLHSEVHRNTLMKVLNETFVAKDILVEHLDRLGSNINADNFIYFYDDEIPEDGKGRCKALYITIHYTSHMKVCGNIVGAFDGTERNIMGKITIPFRVGPAIFEKLKFITEGTLTTIKEEEEITASITTDMPYVEVKEDALESSLQSLKVKYAHKIRDRKKVRAYGQDVFGEPIVILPITQTFTSGGFVMNTLELPWIDEEAAEIETQIEDLSINAVTNDTSGKCSLASIRPCPPG